MVNPPRLVLAAPASGHGKTTVATGLMAALAGRGLAVSGHKVGPDYIDPGYHTLATGRPGRNLDPYLAGEHRVATLFRHGARGADVAVVEGVMGLYDGASGRGELASTAHVAKLLDAPVVLVVDASAQGRSVAALVHGFASYDPEVRLDGVILNRVGSPPHERILREAVTSVGLRVYGACYRSDAVAAPSRHLGLVPACERSTEAVGTVRRLGEVAAECLDLDGLLALARSARPLAAAPWDPPTAIQASEETSHRWRDPSDTWGPPPVVSEKASYRWLGPSDTCAGGRRPRIGVFGGAAFSFCYAEQVELLAAAGAEVVPVDPLRDETLPEGTRGLVVGGGFPEVYASELSANERLRAEVGTLASGGGAVAAECAGLLYLACSLEGLPMCGVLDAQARMTDRLTLGYRDAVAISDCYLARAGERAGGHEFHRTAVTPGSGSRPAWQWSADGPEGYVQRGVHASYLHTHWAGHPRLARRLVEACV